MITSFCDFRDKEVINLCDGRRLGFVCDIEFDTDCGKIIGLLMPPPDKLFHFSAKNNFRIPYDCIEKIGDDIILIRFPGEIPFCKGRKGKEK